MHPTKKAARIAGAIYLSTAVTAPFSLIYLPRTLIVRGDATATASNILSHETLFRLGLFRGADFLAVFDKPQRDAMAMLFLGLRHQGLTINEIFWGLWLFPFGVLVVRSGFLPRILGVWLIVICFDYLVLSSTALLLPQYYEFAFRTASPVLFGELAIALWLLIMGAKVQPLTAASS
jgi:hypothetical protein